jgi:hypothetical protein
MSAAEQDEVPLSVVIATRSGCEALSPVLDSLLEQVRAVGGEVVVASGSAGAASPPRPVRWIAVGDNDLFRLRSIALLATRGAVVAIGEDHAYPRPDWCHAILRAHVEHPDALAVAGCLVNRTDQTTVGRANFLWYGAPYSPPMPTLPPERPPPCSILSFKRVALERLDERLGTFEAEILPGLFDDGSIVADDRIVVDHDQDRGFVWSARQAFVATRAAYGRAHERLDWPARRALARWLVLHLPPRHFGEAWAARAGSRAPRRDYVLVAAFATLAGIGGAVGVLWGAGRARQQVE